MLVDVGFNERGCKSFLSRFVNIQEDEYINCIKMYCEFWLHTIEDLKKIVNGNKIDIAIEKVMWCSYFDINNMNKQVKFKEEDWELLVRFLKEDLNYIVHPQTRLLVVPICDSTSDLLKE